MNKKIEEVWIFDFKTVILGFSFFLTLLAVLGLSVNNLKPYAYMLSILYTIAIIYRSILENNKIREALNWDKRTGTVIDSKKIRKVCLGGMPNSMVTIHIKYKYVIEKEKIYNESWSLVKCELVQYSLAEVNEFLKQLRPRSEIDVFVNPKNRYEAYINRDELLKSTFSLGNTLVTLLVFCMPLFFIAYFA